VGFTLVSIGRIDGAGYYSTFGGGRCIIKDNTGKIIGDIPKSRNLYRVVHEPPNESASIAIEKLTVNELHRRMNHISKTIAKRLVSKGFVTGIRLDLTVPDKFCESCAHAKSTCKPIPAEHEGKRATAYGEEVHSDIWGPAPVEAHGGCRYAVTYTDNATRETHLYLLRHKSEQPEAYYKYKVFIRNQHDTSIKALNTDRSGEYMGDDFVAHLESKGTRQKLSVHDTHEEAGVSECLNRRLFEKVRAMLHASGLPKFLWGESVRHVVWLKNHTSTKALGGRTPFEAVTGSKPDLRGLPEWGCRVSVHDATGTKLDTRATIGYWVGYDSRSKGHHFFFFFSPLTPWWHCHMVGCLAQ
jgi:hypothetical protein